MTRPETGCTFFQLRDHAVSSGRAQKMKFRIAGMTAAALMMAATGAQADNLVTNGSFETGDFTGWTLGSQSYGQFVVPSGGFEGGASCEDGSYCAEIAGYSYAPDTTFQTISTSAGQNYLLSFWIYQDTSGGPTVYLDVDWNGASLLSYLNPSANLNYWQNYSFRVTGTGSDVLNFTDANDCCYSYLDNVQLNAVPEPASWALMLLGSFGLGALLRGARRKPIGRIAAA